MKHARFRVLAVLGLLLCGCAGSRSTVFLHPDYNFNFVERVAVVPFENLAAEQGAGFRATRLFVSELFAAHAFDVVEPGEVSRALERRSLVRTAELTQEQAVGLGKELGVQALILGSVGETTGSRAGTGGAAVVTLVVRMVEAETGTTVWSVTQTEGGRGFWASLLGTRERTEGEVTRRCIEKAVRTLVR